ncbi:MAG: zinc-ribbon domain-containing protein [Chitinivibrionales bacterium]|nr:zinc-ribbon domain-containing protein [Chitinivibrionales bacterium]MBD3395652.1 zinc-ribbon domain-containing protein [Chitinivibrionales bacterium]
MARKETETVPCPHCGAEIRSTARACPYCGSDERTGWSDRTYLDGIDLGDDIDYDDMVEKEFGGGGGARKWWRSWKALAGGALLLALILAYIVRLFW